MRPPTRDEADGTPRDAGMGLAEVMVAMVLAGLVGTMVMTIAILTLKTTSGVQERLDNTTDGELAIAAAGKVLRTAVLPEQLEDKSCIGCDDTAIVTATSTQVTFYANIGDTTVGPSRVTLEVAEDPKHRGTAVLWQRTRQPIKSGDSYTFCLTCPAQNRVLARGLLWPSPGVFSFYDYEGSLMPGATVTAANLPRISSVDLVVTVQHKPGNRDYPPRTAVTRVRLPNVEINVLTDQA
ncbi:hypothetical protein GCM10023340_06510 [Nocardioides marinquilinus]|uniref:Prepilin-type N-terminal cleavage/methylation domain-containing protein n=1 Tax=Nocardioides marinquilinus TaxID=1210400 RepID=A0ABP9P8T0_9ACTN